MPAVLHRLLSKMYSCPAEWYRNTNAAIAAVSFLANGGALAIALSQPTDPLSGQALHETLVLVPIAACALVLSILAWFRPRMLPFALRIQTVCLVLLSGYLAVAAKAQFEPVTQGLRDFWVVGYFTLLLFYTAASVVRFLLPGAAHARSIAFYAPAIVAVVAAAADVSAFIHGFSS